MQALTKVSPWSGLGQWCWIQMLSLKNLWQIELPCQKATPHVDREESVERSVNRLLHDWHNYCDIPSDDRPWVLARLMFVSGLLQPDNLRLLELRDPADSANALQLLLGAGWHQAGRELWRSLTGPFLIRSN